MGIEVKEELAHEQTTIEHMQNMLKRAGKKQECKNCERLEAENFALEMELTDALNRRGGDDMGEEENSSDEEEAMPRTDWRRILVGSHDRGMGSGAANQDD